MSTASQVLITKAPVTNAGALASKSNADTNTPLEGPRSQGGASSQSFAHVLAEQKQPSQQPQSGSHNATGDSKPETGEGEVVEPTSLAGGNILPTEGEGLPQTAVEMPTLDIQSVIQGESGVSASLLSATASSQSALNDQLTVAVTKPESEIMPASGDIVNTAQDPQAAAAIMPSMASLSPGEAISAVQLNQSQEALPPSVSAQFTPSGAVNTNAPDAKLSQSQLAQTAVATQATTADAVSATVMATTFSTSANLNPELKQHNNQFVVDPTLSSDELNLDNLDVLPKKNLAEFVLNTKTDKAPAVTMESLNTLNQVAQTTSHTSSQPQSYQQAANTAAQAQLASPIMMARPGWGEAVVDKVMWMSAQNMKTAEIALDPPELGALQIRVSTQNDQASVSFTSPHANVREALDQNMNRLREMIQGEGLQLVDSEVNEQRSHREQQSNDAEGQLAGDELEDEQGAGQQLSAAKTIRIANPVGLVDQYA